MNELGIFQMSLNLLKAVPRWLINFFNWIGTFSNGLFGQVILILFLRFILVPILTSVISFTVDAFLYFLRTTEK